LLCFSIPLAYDLIDSPPAAVMLRISLGLAGVMFMFWAIASVILYDESVQAESRATPLIVLVEAAARFNLLVGDLYLDSQLVLDMLPRLVVLVLLLKLLFNKLFELLKTRLFLAISIREFKLFVKFIKSMLIFVLLGRHLTA
jgi:hypothetical protein